MKKGENDGYHYLGIAERDTVKEQEMREQFIKEYIRRLKRIPKSKENGTNKIQAIKTWAVTVLSYGSRIA